MKNKETHTYYSDIPGMYPTFVPNTTVITPGVTPSFVPNIEIVNSKEKNE